MSATSALRRGSRPARRGARRVSSQARRSKRRTLVQRTARAGLCARGGIYLILAVITTDIALTGARGKQASGTGAIDELVHQPAGPAAVLVLAAGLAAYAGWRWLQAASGDTGAEGWADLSQRVGWAAIGCVYAVLCGRAILAVAGRSTSSDRSGSYASRVLAQPGGRELLILVGLAVLAGGTGLIVWALLQRFETYLPDRKMPGWVHATARAVTTYGNLARGAVFGGVGASLVVAGLARRPADAKDFDQVLRTLGHSALGPALLLLASVGFAAFAAASGLEAAYRRL